MLQHNSDFFFGRPMIFYGSYQQISEDEACDEWEDVLHPFILDIDPKHPLKQSTGLYLHW